jgi:hypothetical protein
MNKIMNFRVIRQNGLIEIIGADEFRVRGELEITPIYEEEDDNENS